MKELRTFQNPAFGEVRVTEVNGEPMFCLADVAKALGYSNPAKAVIDHCKGVTVLETPTTSGIQPIKFGNEGNVYRLTMRSKLPNAEVFQDWVCDEVLPSIRKTGGYMVARTDDTPEEIMARALLIANDAIKRKDERIAALQRKSDEQQIKIDGDAPKVNFANALTSSDDCILVRELAKLIKQNGVSIGGGRLWAWLREHGYICKNSCEPTQYAMEKNLFVVVTRSIESGNSNPIVKRTTKVTQRGCLYFINKFISCCS